MRTTVGIGSLILVASDPVWWFDLLMPIESHSELFLDAPPRIAGSGVGLHGTRRLQERWVLPDL